MPSLIDLKFSPPLRDLQGNFKRAIAGQVAAQRETVRQAGERYVVLAREEAPMKTGKFRESIRVETYSVGGMIGFRAFDDQPLGLWITNGTKAHAIPKPPRPPGKKLYFYWPKGPKGPGFYSFWNVWHPGTKPNPYHRRAYAKLRVELPSLLREQGLKAQRAIVRPL